MEKTDFSGAQGRIVFFPKGHKWAHGVIVAPKYLTWYGLQWRNEKQVNVWPDGRALHPVLSNDPGWKGIRFEGTVEYELPPWLVEYWKGK
jgi:branched-chain amino acid transport system substrate-binding protein